MQVGDHVLGNGRRDGESNTDIAARWREDRGVDANDFTVEIEGGTTGVAAVHGGVDLQVIVIGAGADIAATGGNDARGYRAAEAEGVTDGYDPVTDANLAIVGNCT